MKLLTLLFLMGILVNKGMAQTVKSTNHFAKQANEVITKNLKKKDKRTKEMNKNRIKAKKDNHKTHATLKKKKYGANHGAFGFYSF